MKVINTYIVVNESKWYFILECEGDQWFKSGNNKYHTIDSIKKEDALRVIKDSKEYYLRMQQWSIG